MFPLAKRRLGAEWQQLPSWIVPVVVVVATAAADEATRLVFDSATGHARMHDSFC